MSHKPGSVRVWWVPQIPGHTFYVDVESTEEGMKLCDVLADYDQFQFDHNIKPDYCNMGGVDVMDEHFEWTEYEEPEEGLIEVEAVSYVDCTPTKYGQIYPKRRAIP